MNTTAPPNAETPAAQTPANPPTMPMPVRIALGLLGTEMLIGLYQTVHGWSAMPSAMPAAARYAVLGSVVGMFALQALFTAGLAWRKNWARIGWLVLTLIGLATLFLPNTVQRPASELILGNVTQVIALVTMYLLFATEGRHWFRRADADHA